MCYQVEDKKFETNFEWGVELTAEHLRYINIISSSKSSSIAFTTSRYLLFCLCHGSYLADTIYKKPVMICNYPKEAKPFYIRLNDDGRTVAAFDVVVPKVWPNVTAASTLLALGVFECRTCI